MLLSVLLLVYLSAYLVGSLVFPYVGMPLAPDILVCPSFFWDVRRVPLAVLLFDNIPLPGYVGVPCCLRPGACEFYVGVLRFSLFLKMDLGWSLLDTRALPSLCMGSYSLGALASPHATFLMDTISPLS